MKWVQAQNFLPITDQILHLDPTHPMTLWASAQERDLSISKIWQQNVAYSSRFANPDVTTWTEETPWDTTSSFYP